VRCWLTITGAFGLVVAGRVGLRVPLLEGWQADGFPVRIAALLVLAVLWGIATGKVRLPRFGGQVKAWECTGVFHALRGEPLGAAPRSSVWKTRPRLAFAVLTRLAHACSRSWPETHIRATNGGDAGCTTPR
jgi:hypothetical protein